MISKPFDPDLLRRRSRRHSIPCLSDSGRNVARWSLRTRLVSLVALALLPVLGVAVWQAELQEQAAVTQRARRSGRSPISLWHGTLDCSMHPSACSLQPVQMSPSSKAPGRTRPQSCEPLRRLPFQAASGLSRPVFHGVRDGRQRDPPVRDRGSRGRMNFSDRDIFQKARRGDSQIVGDAIASRISTSAIIPIAIALRRDGEFRASVRSA